MICNGVTNLYGSAHCIVLFDALDLALDDLKSLQDDLLWEVELAAEAEKLLEDGSLEKNQLSRRFLFQNCMSSCEYGKKVAKMLAEIKDHIGGGVFETVAEAEPTILLTGTGTDVGLKAINNKCSTTPPIPVDIVIWVVVSKDHCVEKVQEKIESHKKFVLFMDDLLEPMNLTKVGIPIPTSENGSKVVECLGPEQAWKLFAEKIAEETLKWEGVKRMSLMKNRVEHLTQTPTCPNLQTLILIENQLKVMTKGQIFVVYYYETKEASVVAVVKQIREMVRSKLLDTRLHQKSVANTSPCIA
ncbi:hypothetical protein GQ457_09G007880 [Hibiscus cannabinus]